ncbi:MAG: DNA primase [Acidobacteriota bacterium]
MIPENKIEEVRNATDIVDYIGRYVKLKKRGKSYLGVCPFHNEKTPSFNVSMEKQMYYCFGCHRGGDVIKFAMEWDKISYPEAIEMLAERAGIALPSTERETAAVNEAEQFYHACRFAGRYFYNNLQTPEGKFALEYFRSRGFSDKTIITFGLGYSMRGWDSLMNRAKEEGIAADTLVRVGLLRTRDDGTHYDAFRGRAMFPIFSATGKVIAFGARKIHEDDTVPGKYINSPETSIYKKSRVLYGLSQSKEAIREADAVILVEGYADLISVFQAGVKNIVASSGTALTDEQIKLLSRYTKNVIFVYDADSAGANAMVRGIDMILEQNMDVRIVPLPAGDDPDSFVRANGGEEFRKLIARAQSFIDFKASTYEKAGKFQTPEGRAEAVRALVQTIAKVPDQLKQSFFIRDLAEKYKLYESSLYTELDKYVKRDPAQTRAEAAPVQHAPAKPVHSAPGPSVAPDDDEDGICTEEKELLNALFENPDEMVPFVFGSITIEEFESKRAKEIALLIVEHFEHEGKVDARAMHESTQDERTKMLIAACSFERYQLSSKWDSIGHRSSATRLYEQSLGAIKGLKRRNVEKAIAENRRRMRDAQLQGGDVLEMLKIEKELYAQKQLIEEMKLVIEKQ